MSLWNDYKGSNLNPVNLFARKDPFEDANKYMEQIPGIGRQYYNPYINSGSRAGSMLEDQYGKLMKPTSFIDDIMKNFKMSEGAKYQKDTLGRDINATAAAGGFAGTPEHQQEYGEMSDKIMSGDMQQYLQNALGVYGMGLTGEQDMYGKGYDASSRLADMIAGTLGSQATGVFQSDNQTNTSRDAFLNTLIKALSQGAGSMGG
jgi:hypothetical protein